MTRLTRRIIICIVVCAASAAHTSAQIADSQGAKKGRYKAIEVNRFDVEPTVSIPENQVNVLMLEIVDEMYKLKKFDTIIKPSSKSSIEPSPSGPTIRLSGTFTKYYALIPEKDTIQAGGLWNHIRVKIKFTDASDGKILLEKEIDRRVILGPYLLDFHDVTRKAAKEIAKITNKEFF